MRELALRGRSRTGVRCGVRGTCRCTCDERGTIAPLVVMAALLLFAVLAFSIDQGIACVAKVKQENALDAARDACMDASFALVVKNDDEPGRAVAHRIAETLRREGFAGEVAVWFYEAPAAEVPTSRRVWGIAIQVQEQSPTVFARGFGIASLPVASKRIVMAEPFADTVVWRPGHDVCGRFELTGDAEVSALLFERLSRLDEYPAELAAALRASIAMANSKL